MRSFGKHKLMTEFVENLFEFNLEDRKDGSLATWSSKGFEKVNWVIAELSQHGITLTEDSIFLISFSNWVAFASLIYVFRLFIYPLKLEYTLLIYL